MPGGSAAVSETSFAGASGRRISYVFITGPGFNFLSLTKSVSGIAICPFDTFWPQQNMKNR